jgi:uncharacterized protein
MPSLIDTLHQQTNFSKSVIKNILTLLDEGATIPFIARYRKEQTDNASDESLREFYDSYTRVQNLLAKKEDIKRLITEKGKITPALETLITNAKTLSELDDIYLPFKEKKATRAGVAIQAGLEPLANILQSSRYTIKELYIKAKSFLSNEIKTVDDALQGAKDIVAERYSEHIKERQAIKKIALTYGALAVKKSKTFDENGVYKQFANHREKLTAIPSHRFLAINRGVKEKQLSMKIAIDTDRIFENIAKYKIKKEAKDSKSLLLEAYIDGFKRLLFPSISRQIFSELKERADTQAISVFGKNLSQLLLTPPVTKKILLGVDPGFATGCKLAVIDEEGTFLDSGVIYPTAPKNDYESSKKTILKLTKQYNISGVAIGNGTASNETQTFFAQLNSEGHTLAYTVVSEAGASVYSASKLAQEEYPELDVTIRGAISIAARLRDPMATLVKIDPKSLGIGQYQHDVDQKLLSQKLGDTTQDLVNRVGVDLNSASVSLLSYVAGISQKLAKTIVDHKKSIGRFESKEELLSVKGLGKKAYEQCAGFLRIKEGKSVLDNTGVHPESYHVAKQLIKQNNLETLQIDETLADQLNIGLITLKDIITELKKPGFDVRTTLPSIPFKVGLTDISMLKEGSIVSGVVRNIADFGAFVDIGLKNDGMIHISKMSEKRIAHPLEVLSVNQYLPRIEVISLENGKIGLSLL